MLRSEYLISATETFIQQTLTHIYSVPGLVPGIKMSKMSKI